MMVTLAKRMQRISASPTLALLLIKNAKKEQGIHLLDFGAGEPDFSTPQHIKEAGISAIDNNATKYTPTAGIPELKRAVSYVYRQDYGLNISQDEIMITPGSKFGLFLIMQAIVDHGDEVILPRPFWVTYPELITYCGGTPIYADHLHQDPPMTMLAKTYIDAWTPKTKLVIINTPSNPSGVKMSDEEMAEVIRYFSSRNVLVVVDDCYRHINFDDKPQASPYQLVPEARSLVVVISSLSKSYAMTGWRLGYTIANPELSEAMSKLAGQSITNPCSISQYAAIAALTGPSHDLNMMVETYRFRRDFVCHRLGEIGNIRFTIPQGAFYLFPDFSLSIKTLGLKDDVHLAQELLEKENMIWVPGSVFGAPNHLRFSFATSDEDISQGMNRLEHYLNE